MATVARTSSVESRLAPGYENYFQIGGILVLLLGDCDADVELLPALEPFRIESGCPDIRVRVEWVQSLSVEGRLPLFDSGTTWRAFETGSGLQFDFNSPALGCEPYKRLRIDGRFGEATLQMSRASFQNCPREADPLEYPLDELLIMHRLTQEKAIELHGSGIVRANGEANLFVGHSGAGKSTTTRMWTAVEDVDVLSDDRIIVRRDCKVCVEIPCDVRGSASERGVLRLRDRSALPAGRSAQDDSGLSGGCAMKSATVVESSCEAGGSASERGVLRLRDRSALPAGRSAQDDKKCLMRMYGTPWHGEAMFASPDSALLTRIFVIEHGHGNVITPLSPSQAVAELFARSFVPFHRHEYVDSALEFLQELVNAVPVYRYAFEPDQRAVETIRNFHD